MTRQKTVNVSPGQLDFIGSDESYTLFCGGLGSGKTHAGAIWAAMQCRNNPTVRGLITANSYSQLKKATLPKFFQILDEWGISYKYKSQDGVIEVGKATVYAISMEKFDLLRGIEVGWSWSDECAFYREEAYNVLIGRIRDARGSCQWKGTTTPNGFNWLYKRFVEKPSKSSKVVYGKTADNISNLKPGYLDDLAAQYDKRLAEQELGGQFVNLNAGRVYHSFDRRLHVVPVKRYSEQIFVGLDFNVHPMCGVYAFYRNGIIYIQKELYQENSNTFAAAKEIKETYQGEFLNVVPDATGNKRHSSSSTTDHEILRRAGLNVIATRNPSVRDRQNNVNRLLDHGKLYIDPSCTHLIAELEQFTHENKDEMLGHILDGLGYVCWHIDPLKKPKREASVSHY
jgi:phage terminase large subunit